jgi:hypothetical protein
MSNPHNLLVLSRVWWWVLKKKEHEMCLNTLNGLINFFNHETTNWKQPGGLQRLLKLTAVLCWWSKSAPKRNGRRHTWQPSAPMWPNPSSTQPIKYRHMDDGQLRLAAAHKVPSVQSWCSVGWRVKWCGNRRASPPVLNMWWPCTRNLGWGSSLNPLDDSLMNINVKSYSIIMFLIG